MSLVEYIRRAIKLYVHGMEIVQLGVLENFMCHLNGFYST